MTTIAYRDGIMAADTGAQAGEARHIWADKLAKGRDGTLYGVAGDAAGCHRYLEWVRSGYAGPPPLPIDWGQDKGSSFLILTIPPNGTISVITSRGTETYPRAPYYAIGYDAAVAYGSLFYGADANEAIAACLEHGTGTYGNIHWIAHDGIHWTAHDGADEHLDPPS